MLGVSETPDESSFTAAPEKPSTVAIVCTSRSGSAAVWTRNRNILLVDTLPKSRAGMRLGWESIA